MDIQEILSRIDGNPMYNLHSHTQFCDGRADISEFAAEADRQGFTVYGFTPHSPTSVESACNMDRADVPQYFAEVDRLKGLYPHITWLKGMEIDYLDNVCGPASEYYRNLGLDYSIGSVHFIPDRSGVYVDIDGRPARFMEKLHDCFHDDLRYVVETYFAQSQQMIAAGGFDIVGHFDKIRLNASYAMPDIEDCGWYTDLVNDLVDAIIASGKAVEINTKAFTEYQRLFPSQRHWRRLLSAGVSIVVNSDAHYPNLINANRLPVIKALDYLRLHGA